MDNIAAFRDRINQEIENLSRDLKSEPAELYEPMVYTLMLGGKRMRPVLLLAACHMFEGNTEQAVLPALGIEIFHNFTLLHDDIMDKAPLRRNKPTVHQKWNESIAILSGDVMFVKAYQYMCQVEQAKLPDVLTVFNQLAIQVCEGQQWDMNFENEAMVSIKDYLNMIMLKTAVLLGGSLKIGAIIGGAEKSEAEKLDQFGKNIGIAFQLQDDILDVYGISEKFGKQTGGDIVANKKTFLLIKALELAKGEVLHELKEKLYTKQISDPEKVKAVKEIYDRLHVKRYAEEMMQHYYEMAIKNLSDIRVDESRKFNLQSLAENLMVREF